MQVSYVSGRMRRGEILHANPHHFFHGRRSVEKAAGEDLLAGLSEVFGQEGVKNGVYTGVSIGQAVRDDAEGKGSIVQGELSELHPHCYDVVRHPADEEGSDDQHHRLRCLKNEDKKK